MDVACQQCQAKFKIPDAKVPKGQAFSITCPKCKSKIALNPRDAAGAAAPADSRPTASGKDAATGGYNAADRPFDFVEEGAQTALICEANPTVRAKVKAALEHMGYHITTPRSAREVLKQMRFHLFDLVVLNERFDAPNPDANNVLRYMDRLSMSHRRNMFVVLLTDRFRTMDDMAAFNKSVHMVVNLQSVDEIDKILQTGLTHFTNFYRIFREGLAKIGQS